jgi:mannosyltransferase OCH1-like enzyme
MNKKEVMSFVKSLGSNLIKNSAIENGFSHSEKVLEIKKNKYSNNKSIPKRVWIYWDSVEMSRFIKAIIDNNKKRNPEYDFIVLNSENLFDYIPRVNFHSDLLPAHKADYIRLVLLNLYGGIWLDATTVLVQI